MSKPPPIVLPIDVNSILVYPCGGEDEASPSRLLGTVTIAHLDFHVECIQVNKAGRAVWKPLQESLDTYYTLNGSTPNCVRIGQRQYVILIYPFGNG